MRGFSTFLKFKGIEQEGETRHQLNKSYEECPMLGKDWHICLRGIKKPNFFFFFLIRVIKLDSTRYSHS